MKKFLIFSLCVGIAFFFNSCSEGEPTFEVAEGVKPLVSGGGVFLKNNLENESASFTVDVGNGSSAKADAVQVYKSFNGEARVLHTTVTSFPTEVTFTPAQAADGTTADPNTLDAGDNFDFTFEVDTNDGRTLVNSTSVNIPVVCPSELEGTYSVSTTYGFHDYLADFPSHSMLVELEALGDGFYSVVDLSGGLYSVGPYVEAYGTTGVPATILEKCATISWTGVEDDWGEVVPTEGGVNSVNEDTGVITISWTCLAYGENGVSVYTPQ